MSEKKLVRNAADLARKYSLTAVLSASTFLASGLIPSHSAHAGSIVVHPAACRATFLDQAFPMRWHEYFLMNPDSNVPTYIICPMTFDPDVVTLSNGGTFGVTVFGGIMSAASPGLPTCEFKVHNRDNLKQGIYIDRAPNHTYSEGLASQTNGTLWAAAANINRTDVSDDVGSTSQYFWALSVVCLMPPGYSVSQILLQD